jgi:RNA polymerase sigma-70 factor (ECF subfamily)
MTTNHSGNQVFETAFQMHKNKVYDFALRLLGNRDAAADVTQETFIRLFKTLQDGNGIKNVESWLFIVNRNLCLKSLRDQRHTEPLDDITETTVAAPDEHSADRSTLRRAISRLEIGHREALILREYSGLTYSEMAEILQTTESAIKSLLFRARVQLKEEFARCRAERDRYELR